MAQEGPNIEKSDIDSQVDHSPAGRIPSSTKRVHVKWYRSTWYNAVMLGLANFCAPGICKNLLGITSSGILANYTQNFLGGAMNALGGGGEQSPWLVNTANALTFCCMILTCALSGVFVKYLGIRLTLVLGASGYCLFAAGLYCNNRFGSSWFVLFGATTCGLGAGIFWMAEAAIALSYPEPYNQGKFLGLWLMFRVGGQVLGGAVNLGLNVNRNERGSVSYQVYQVFIALQAAAPFVGLLLTAPEKVQRTDGVTVSCNIPRTQSTLREMKETGKLFLSKRFLLVVPLIAQSVFAEAVYFSFQGLWFTVRARALASFLSGVVAMFAGNVLGAFLDRKKWSERVRGRWGFLTLVTLQGAWWIYGVVIVTQFRQTRPTFDWTSPGFGKGFAWFLLMVSSNEYK